MARTVRLLASCAPLLFAVPVLYALANSFMDVVGTAHPFFGDVSGSAADARAIALGVPLYQDPDLGYTPLTYTPLMSVLGGALGLVADWDGWVVAITILADAALMAVATRLAYRRGGSSRLERATILAGALGMGAIAFWLAGFVPFSVLYAPRPDQLSWALALTGLVLVPVAAGGSRAAGAAAIALLSMGWWTKQTAILAGIAAAAWLTLAAVRGVTPWRRWGIFVGGLVLIGGASFGLAHLLTDGWSTVFTVDMPEDRARPASLGESIHDLLVSVLPAAAVAISLGLAAALAGRSRGLSARTFRGDGSVVRTDALGIVFILVLFIVLDIPAAVWFREAVGVVHNQFLGIAWALGLLAALFWGLAQRKAASAVAAAFVVIGLFAGSESPLVGRWLHDEAGVVVPAKALRAIVFEQSPDLREYAGDHLIYHPGFPGIGVNEEADLYPGQDNVTSLTWSGRQPGHLVRALLNRRFDVVYPLASHGAGGTGRWEANYIWKLNEVIRAKYRSGQLPRELVEARVLPFPFSPFVAGRPLVRRSGPDPAPWMAHCFGPFEIDGVSWRIAAGGGFWCRPGSRGTVLELVRTPAAFSEIRADDYEADVPGRITVRAARRGVVEVEAGDRRMRRVVGPGRPAALAVPSGSHGIRVWASAGSRARVELGDLAS